MLGSSSLECRGDCSYFNLEIINRPENASRRLVPSLLVDQKHTPSRDLFGDHLLRSEV